MSLEKSRVGNRINLAGVAGVVLGFIVFMAVRHLPEGSATLPRVVATLMIVLGILEVLRTLIIGPNAAERELRNESEAAIKKPLKPALVFIAATLGYVLAIPILGFYISTALFMVTVMLFLGVRKINLLVITPIIVIGSIYFIMTLQLRIPLPRGLII